MIKKRILALLLVVTMACCAVACGSKAADQNNDKNTERESIEEVQEPTTESEEIQKLDENAIPYLGVWVSARGQILAFYEDGTCYLNGDNNHTFQMNGETCAIDEINTVEITDETGDCLYIDFPELGMGRKYYRGTEESVEEQKNANSDISWMIGEWKYDDTRGYTIGQIVIRDDGTCDLMQGVGDVIYANWEKSIVEQEDFSGITIYVDGEPRYCFAGIPMLQTGYFADELPVDDFSFDKFSKE